VSKLFVPQVQAQEDDWIDYSQSSLMYEVFKNSILVAMKKGDSSIPLKTKAKQN
jgi:hypothetical protein